MRRPARLCLVEDERTIRKLISDKLISQGYQVDAFDKAEPTLQTRSAKPQWDLYIIDIMLAGEMTGLDLCQELRKAYPTVPLLILSALSQPPDRVKGLRKGADDYLTKPFEMDELLLRIKALLKRRPWYGDLPMNQANFEWADSAVNFLSFQGQKGKESFRLTQKECMLLKVLVEKEGEIVTREEILDRVWGYEVYPSTRTVDNFVMRLRKYYESTPNRPKHIHSVRGMGYRFTKEAIVS